MDPSLSLAALLKLAVVNIWLTGTCVVVIVIHSWVLARIMWRVEASAEHIAQMVRELHNR